MSSEFLDAFTFISDRWSNLLQELTIQHLIISGESILISILIGLPIGALLGHIHRFSFLAINTSNLARALPSLAVLGFLLPYTGAGDTTIIIAMVILAAPPILTNSYVAIDQVDPDTVDAARGNGLKAWQILLTVEIPMGLPLIFAGMRTSAVFVIATVTLKGFFGSGGLGNVISDPASYGITGVIGASYVLIGLAILVQILFIIVEYAITPIGLRRTRSSLTSRLRSGKNKPLGVQLQDPAAANTLDQAQPQQDFVQQGSPKE